MSGPWVNAHATADHLGKSVYTVRVWARTGKIPGSRVGRDWMFQLDAVDAELNKPAAWARSPQSRGRRRKAA